jgi:hypothetical protein
MELKPIIVQTGPINRVAREVIRQQPLLPSPKAFNPYALYREESITCRETAAGTYECISVHEPGIHEQAGYKGQLIDLWI